MAASTARALLGFALVALPRVAGYTLDPVRIVYVHTEPWVSASPAVTFITYNAIGMAEAGVETHLVVRNQSEGATEALLEQHFGLQAPPGLVLHRLTAKRHWGFYRQAIRLIRDLDDGRLTVVTRALSFLPHLLLLRAQRPSLRILFETHDYHWRTALRNDVPGRSIWKKSLYERLCFPRLDGMICLMESQRTLYREHLPRLPIAVLRTGVHAVHAPVLPKPQLFAYVGSLDRYKGVDQILTSIAHLGAEAQVLIVGGKTAEEQARLQERARDLGLHGRVRITGWIDKKQLSRELAQVKWGMVPLEDNFFNAHLTSPLKLFDFAAHGIPVLASDLPTLRELVIPGRTGFLVDWSDGAGLRQAAATSDAAYAGMVTAVIAQAEAWRWVHRGHQLKAFATSLRHPAPNDLESA